jgi:hypothetical protein
MGVKMQDCAQKTWQAHILIHGLTDNLISATVHFYGR